MQITFRTILKYWNGCKSSIIFPHVVLTETYFLNPFFFAVERFLIVYEKWGTGNHIIWIDRFSFSSFLDQTKKKLNQLLPIHYNKIWSIYILSASLL